MASARPAPGAPQHSGGGDVGGLGQGHIPGLAQILGGGVESHGHIGARVSVGDGEHVQLVDFLLVDFNGCGSGEQHLPVGSAVNGQFQIYSLHVIRHRQ